VGGITVTAAEAGQSVQEDTMAHPITVPEATLKARVLESATPTLVDFWAEWCGPCRILAPVIDELASTFDGRLKVAKVDVDANPATARTFSVLSIPTLLVFSGGEVVDQLVGYQSKQVLMQRLEAVLKADRVG